MIELLSTLLIFACGFCWGIAFQAKRNLRDMERLLKLEEQQIAEFRAQLRELEDSK